MSKRKQTDNRPLVAYGNTDSWYRASEDKVVKLLWPYIQLLEQDNSAHFNKIITNTKLYTNQHIGIGKRGVFQPLANQGKSGQIDHATINVIQSCVDTVTSRVAGTSKPAIVFYTDTEGDGQSIQLKSKKLTRFVERPIWPGRPIQARTSDSDGWRSVWGRVG